MIYELITHLATYLNTKVGPASSSPPRDSVDSIYPDQPSWDAQWLISKAQIVQAGRTYPVPKASYLYVYAPSDSESSNRQDIGIGGGISGTPVQHYVRQILIEFMQSGTTEAEAVKNYSVLEGAIQSYLLDRNALYGVKSSDGKERVIRWQVQNLKTGMSGKTYNTNSTDAAKPLYTGKYQFGGLISITIDTTRVK